MSSGGRSRPDRRSWPVRVYRLGDEPPDDLSATTTAEERLAMVDALSIEAWGLAGRTFPEYLRQDTPVSTRPWRVRP
jgi:hypothetical protein